MRAACLLAIAVTTLACGDDTKALQTDEHQASASLPTSYGFLATEPIIEDGARTDLMVAPNLVERIDELHGALPLLDEANVSLSMTIQDAKLQTPAAMEEIFALVQAAADKHIEVRPVPVLSDDLGYFPNATNVDQYVPVVRNLVAQWKAKGFAPTTLIVDMEPPRKFSAALAAMDYDNAAGKDYVDRPRYARALVTFSDLADELHAAGWKVAVTTQGTVLADYVDGDDNIRQYFNVVLEGVRWDQVDFQLYRSAYESLSPGLDAHFVYYCAQLAALQFPGIPVGIGLGLTHPGPIFPDAVTEDVANLKADLQAAVAAGVKRELITIYNLKGVLVGPPRCPHAPPCAVAEYGYQPNDPRSWFIDARGATAPAENPATAFLFSQLKRVDDELIKNGFGK